MHGANSRATITWSAPVCVCCGFRELYCGRAFRRSLAEVDTRLPQWNDGKRHKMEPRQCQLIGNACLAHPFPEFSLEGLSKAPNLLPHRLLDPPHLVGKLSRHFLFVSAPVGHHQTAKSQLLRSTVITVIAAHLRQHSKRRCKIGDRSSREGKKARHEILTTINTVYDVAE